MIPATRNLPLLLLWALLAAVHSARAQPSALRAPDPAAGAGATTLLVYNARAQPYSLLDVQSLVAHLLTRVNTSVLAMPSSHAKESDFAAADYVVLLGIGAWEDPHGALKSAANAGRRVLAIGTSGPALARHAGSGNLWRGSPAARFVRSATLSRGGAEFHADMASVVPAASDGGPNVEVLARAQWSGRTRPLAWRGGNVFWFSALPVEPATGFVFSDILLDFYGVDDAGPSGIVCVLDDCHPGSDSATLRRAADLLAARGLPFALSARVGRADDTTPRKAYDFLSALRYAQARKGRIFLTADADAFWDAASDQPPPPDALRQSVASLDATFDAMAGNDVFPLGVRLPDAGVARGSGAALSRVFRLAIGGAQASDATAAATFQPGTVTAIAPGVSVIPLSLWFHAREQGADRIALAQNLLKLRGTVLGVSIPAWLPFDEAAGAIEAAMNLSSAPFLDPMDATVGVTTGEHILANRFAPPLSPRFAGTAEVRTFDTHAAVLSSRDEVFAGNGPPVSCPDDAAFTVAGPPMP